VWSGGLGQHAVVIALLLGGCSINGLGLADTQIIRVDGSTVLTSWRYGLQLNTASPEAGITWGYTRSVEVLPGQPDQLLPGRYPFGVSLPDTPAAASFRRVAGLEIGLNRTMIGVSLGLSEQLTVAPVDAGASITRLLLFWPSRPEEIRLQMCEGDSQC
jgi:hypothetical protein